MWATGLGVKHAHECLDFFLFLRLRVIVPAPDGVGMVASATALFGCLASWLGHVNLLGGGSQSVRAQVAGMRVGVVGGLTSHLKLV